MSEPNPDTIQHTPVHNLPYPTSGYVLKYLQHILRKQMEAVEDALTYTGHPPVGSDLADLMAWKNDTDLILTTAAEDTGWVTFSPNSGVTARSGFPPRVRRIHGVVYLECAFVTNLSTETQLCVVPEGFRPSREVRWTGAQTARWSSGMVGGLLNTSGILIMQNPGSSFNSTSSHFNVIIPPYPAS